MPIMGSVPDGAIVLFSGLGPHAQEHLTVGVGTLRATLSPSDPAWRIVDLPAASARAIAWRANALLALFTFEHFIHGGLAAGGISPELEAFFEFAVSVPAVALMLALLPDRLWTVLAAGQATEGAAVRRRIDWAPFRRAVGLIALASLLATALGYVALGRFVIEGLMISAVVLGTIALFRRFFREAAARLPQTRFGQERLGMDGERGGGASFWLGVTGDIVLLIVTASFQLTVVFENEGEDARMDVSLHLSPAQPV